LKRENWLLLSKKKEVKTKFIDLGMINYLTRLLLSLGCWLMLARRFCVYSVGLKVDTALEILIVIIDTCSLIMLADHTSLGMHKHIFLKIFTITHDQREKVCG